MHETCTKAVKGMPQCKNSLANCANSRAVAGMSITGWKQGCNMAVTGCLPRNFELNVTGLFQGCYIACEQALCLGKNSEEREWKGGGEPVNKHLRPLFRLL